MSVTAEYLLKGSALALEQCGLLLRDACQLYESRSFATSLVLAAFAREELGRSRILLDLCRRRLTGSPVTVEEITAACDKHAEKQRAAMLSTTMRPDRDGGLGKILSARMKNPPQSKEWQEANAALKKIDAKLAKRTPNDRHGERMTALYVEPRSATEWNRPADKSAKEAFEFLVDAINDYRGPYHRHRIGSVESTMLLEDDPELYRVLEQMADRPTLWCPINPSWPG